MLAAARRAVPLNRGCGGRATLLMSTTDFYSSELDNLPIWVTERPLLPGFQERAGIELYSWWNMNDSPEHIVRMAANASVGTLVRVFVIEPDPEVPGEELSLVLQSRMRVKALRVRASDGLQFADVQVFSDTEEVAACMDLAVHALCGLPGVGTWLDGAKATLALQSVAQAAAVATASAWTSYEFSSRVGSFKYGSTELARMNVSADSVAVGQEAHSRAKHAALQAAKSTSMRWSSPAGLDPTEPEAATSDVDAQPVHVVLAASAAAKYLRRGTASVPQAAKMDVQEAEWALWLAIDSVWYLLSKLSAKRALLLPEEVLHLQPPPPPGGWKHQYCMQQGAPHYDWGVDAAYPLIRRAQRLSFVAASLMPGSPQQQILSIDGIAKRLVYLQGLFERHEMALRSLVALQEIDASGRGGADSGEDAS